MQNVTNPTVKTHVVWLDVVRLIAMFTVVCCHCTDPFNFYPGDSPIIGDIKFWGAAYGAFLRPCVPLFVMITGALLLPVREETSIFYKKRILRVFWPFLIWSVIYNLFPWFTGLLGLRPELILDFFPYSGEEVTPQSFSVSLGCLFLIIGNSYLLTFGVDAHGMNSVCFIISPGLTVTCYWGIICGIMIGRQERSLG